MKIKNLLGVGLGSSKVSKAPILEAIQQDWRSCLIALSLLFLHATTFYAVFTFMPTLISETNAFVPGMALKYISLFLFVRLFIIPLVGITAEKMGGKNIIRLSSILFIILSYSLFSKVHGAEMPGSIIALALFALLTTFNAGTVPGLLAEILPAKTRYTTFSFTLNAGFGIFGGIAPLVLQFIINNTGTLNNASFYLIFSAIMAFIGTLFIRKERATG